MRWIATGAGNGRSARTSCWPAATRDTAAATRSAPLRKAYARGEDDEFVAPTIVGQARPIEDGDAFVFFNFRPDRARQLTTAFDAGTTQYYHDPFDAFAAKAYGAHTSRR